jgi:hypothetical protein
MSLKRTAGIAFVFLIGIAAGTQVHAGNDVSLTGAVAVDSNLPITRSVPHDVARWAAERQHIASTEAGLWQFPQRSGRVHRAKCQSKKKGLLIGAAIGGAGGAALALYVNRGVGGVAGTASGANRYLAYWTAGGAGGGALVGFAYCL